MRRDIVLRFGLFVLIFYLLTIIITQFFNIGIQELRYFVQGFGILAPIVYTFLIFLGLSVPLNPISDFLLINLGVLMFPPYVAIIATFIAHSLSIVVNYYIGKRFGKKVLQKVITPQSAAYLDKYLQKLTIKKLFIIRFIVPIATVFGADVVSYVSGMKNLPFLKYFLVSIIPWTVLSIIYYTTSSYLLNISVFLYFIPVAFIVGIPLLGLYFYKIRKK